MTEFWMCGKVYAKMTKETKRGEFRYIFVEDGDARNKKFGGRLRYPVVVRLSKAEFNALEEGMIVLINGTIAFSTNPPRMFLIGQKVRVVQGRMKALAEVVQAKQDAQRLKNYKSGSKISEREIPLKYYEKYTKTKK